MVGRRAPRELVRADGEPRASTREGCTGTEGARFSEDGRRIYLEADHDCEGVARQRTTGVLTMRSTVHNQDDVLVLEGMQRYLLKKRGT